MKYYSIGVPIGALNEQPERYFYVDRKLYHMNRDAYKVWRQFLFGSTRERVLQKKSLTQELGEDGVTQYISALQEAEMIVNQETLWHRIPQRQGIGIGVDPKTHTSRMLLNGELSSRQLSYLIWVYSDGKTPLDAVIHRLPEELSQIITDQQVFSAVDELLVKNALIFTD